MRKNIINLRPGARTPVADTATVETIELGLPKIDQVLPVTTPADAPERAEGDGPRSLDELAQETMYAIKTDGKLTEQDKQEFLADLAEQLEAHFRCLPIKQVIQDVIAPVTEANPQPTKEEMGHIIELLALAEQLQVEEVDQALAQACLLTKSAPGQRKLGQFNELREETKELYDQLVDHFIAAWDQQEFDTPEETTAAPAVTLGSPIEEDEGQPGFEAANFRDIITAYQKLDEKGKIAFCDATEEGNLLLSPEAYQILYPA